MTNTNTVKFDNVCSSQGTGEDELEVEAYMIGDYIDGPTGKAAARLVKQETEMSRNDWTSVRDSLALQCLLNNAKRAGDITHLLREQVLNAKVPANKDRKVEMKVSDTS